MADRQFGVVARRQLLDAGLASNTIDRWATVGWLRRVHRGVYALGHRVLTTDGRRLAAVLACGERAVLSHGDAAAAWGLAASHGLRFHVTVPPTRVRAGPRPGIHVHVSRLGPGDITEHGGIPITSVARTLLDHASISTEKQVAGAVDMAITLDLFDQAAVDAVTGRGRAGSVRLKKVIATRHPSSHEVKSGWERDMLRMLDAHGLPRPEVNATLASQRISPDLLRRRERLAVEWDSWRHHRTRDQWEADHEKTVRLQRLGFRVLRFTWRQVRAEPELVIADIRRELSRTS